MGKPPIPPRRPRPYRRQHHQWFKQRRADATGLDLNTPPAGPLPELLSSYTADGRR